jgi:hypothetical protein
VRDQEYAEMKVSVHETGLPTFSFFLASTLITGWPAAWCSLAWPLI